ncbi:MAG: hypothetical protein H7232_12205 [Aeromicrobium sp.]|nr:hypothetical protein [Burkholderiales bacterium]
MELAARSGAAAPASMNRIVQSELQPQLEYLFDRLSAEKLKLSIDGVRAFNGRDKFLPGKIAVGLSHLLVAQAKADPANTRLAESVQRYRELADLTIGMDNDTWGIYYYLLALNKLQAAGLLQESISPKTLAALRTKLDWRKFVIEADLSLINLPTNYYGVAFSIARLRMMLGWEDASGSERLLTKTLEHYQKYSGKFGFSDETDGEGRFDRYSILLVAEICQRFVETGLTVTPELKKLLRNAASVALNIANIAGDGFSFGRSIGPYADTSILEILSISAYLDVLTAEEKKYAYAYATRITEKYVNFWFDPKMHSVDMWGKGRRTDAYRGKHRILGENFSLLHQLISTNQLWIRAGFGDQAPVADLSTWLDRTQPKFNLVWFAQGEYDRALAIIRDRQYVFSLLLVNGGTGQHANSPYYPLPFSNLLIAGVADGGPAFPQLLPTITLADGARLLPTTFIKNIKAESRNGVHHVRYEQDAFTLLGKSQPVKDGRIRLETEYQFSPGRIVRIDRVIPNAPVDVASISLDFASFSDRPVTEAGRTVFGEGAVRRFEVDGLAKCTSESTAGREEFMSPSGPMKTWVNCRQGPLKLDSPMTLRWSIDYQ